MTKSKIDDLKELLAAEYNGMEVPYKFEKVEKQPKKCLKTG